MVPKSISLRDRHSSSMKIGRFKKYGACGKTSCEPSERFLCEYNVLPYALWLLMHSERFKEITLWAKYPSFSISRPRKKNVFTQSFINCYAKTVSGLMVRDSTADIHSQTKEMQSFNKSVICRNVHCQHLCCRLIRGLTVCWKEQIYSPIYLGDLSS